MRMEPKDVETFVGARMREGWTDKQFTSNQARIHAGLAAGDQIKRLIRSEDFQRKFKANDPDAVQAFDVLTRRQADGLAAASELAGSPDVNQQAQQSAAVRDSVAALANDPKFIERLNRGDVDATRQWREVNVLQSAEAVGVPLSEAAPAPAQPAAASPTNATGGV